MQKSIHEKFGQAKKDWEAFKAEAREHMIATAARGGMITYGDLAAMMTSVVVE
jgi:hypothetical protein